jgi:hypothetical protein
MSEEAQGIAEDQRIILELKAGVNKGWDVISIGQRSVHRVSALSEKFDILGMGLKKGGFHLLRYPAEDDAWPEGCLAPGEALIQEKPQVIKKVVNAVVAATEYAKTHRNEAVAVAMKHVGYLGEEAVQGNYDVLRDW